MSFRDYGDASLIPLLGIDANGKLTLDGDVVGARENDNALNKLGMNANGAPMWNGEPFVAESGGIQTAATPSALPANAENGTVAVALADDAAVSITYPAQVSGESVSVDIAGKNIRIGNPEYDASALASAIAAGEQDGQVTAAVDFHHESDGLTASLVPVVNDLSLNDFTSAGITIEKDSCILDENATYKYALIIEPSYGILNPDKYVDVDATHRKYTGAFFYVFENISGDVLEMPGTLTAGWNVLMLTMELVNGDPTGEPTAAEFVSAQDINEYVSFPSTANATMAVSGTGASDIFDQIIEAAQGRQKGLYMKLSGDWHRCTME